jgi:tetratricopeptide (TPR) repeat protein
LTLWRKKELKNSKENNSSESGIVAVQPPFKNLLLKQIKETKESIFLITPELKTNMVKLISNILLDSPPEDEFLFRIMTKLNEEEIIDGKSDLEALEILSNLSIGPKFKLEIRGVENLNANVFIFDNKRAIVTSGGLSAKSLTSNIEYGMLITDLELVEKIISDFNGYWDSSDELKIPDFKYFISQIQEHDTSIGGFLKLGSSILPIGKDLDDIGPLEGETLAKKYLSKARDHEETGEYEKALDFYNKALVATPSSVDILRDKAVLLKDELERPNEALETYNKILSIEPTDERASLESGKILVKNHRYWDALIKLDISTNSNPSNEAGWYWKSIILSETPNRLEDSLQCLDEVIKNDPNNEDAWYLKGKILSKELDRYSEADRCFNTVTRINPKNEAAWLDKGRNLFFNLKKPMDAIKCFDKVTKANKTNALGWYFKGKVLTESYKKDKDALSCFSQAVKIDPNYKNALFSQGILLLEKLSKPEKAITTFEKLLEIDKDNENSLFEIGMIYGKELKDNQKALEYFMRALSHRGLEEEAKKESIYDKEEKFDGYPELLKYLDDLTLDNPKNSKAWYLKGAILDRIYSRFKDALKCFDEATRLKSDFKEAWHDKAVILITVYGRNDDALKCLNKAISINKNDEIAWYVKSKALMDEEKYEDALACLEKVIKINPENPRAYENIANSLINLSRLKDSIEYFDKAIKLDSLNTSLLYNKGNTLLSLRRYQEALECYKNVLNINPSHELALSNYETYSDKNNWV